METEKKREDIPYNILKDNERYYAAMLMRDVEGLSYHVIAAELGISLSTLISKYNRWKIRQARLYVNHLAVVTERPYAEYFEELQAAHNCYCDVWCMSAYFEKTYGELLSVYRAGEPGTRQAVLDALPPFRRKFSKQTIARVVELREVEKKTYPAIAKRMRMTEAKAKWLYHHHYHILFMEYREKVKQATGGELARDYFRTSHLAKKRYEMIVADYPGF